MQITWRREAKQSLQQDLPRCRREQIGATHDVGDSLRIIVDDDGKLLRVKPVAATHDEIADVGAQLLLLRAIKSIAEFDRRVVDAYAHRATLSRCGDDAVAACAGIHALADRRDDVIGSLGARARTGKRTLDCNELRQRFVVTCASRRLKPDGAVPLEAHPLECGQDCLGCARTRARRVDILDAQQPIAPGSACVGIARNGCDERPEVQWTRGRWREAPAVAAARVARLRRSQRSDAVVETASTAGRA